MANKIPVGDTINFAYSFTFGNLLQIVGLTWLPLAVTSAISYYTMDVWLSWFSNFRQMMANGGHPPDQQAVMNMMSGMGSFAGMGLLTMLVSLFMAAIVGVAVTNQALGLRTGQTFVHVAAGAPEWRVFGGYIRLFFAVLGLYLLCFIGGFISVYVGNAIGGTAGGAVMVILIIALACLMLLTIVRMAYLLTPSIVAEPGRGGLARSYQLTRGNFWRIFVVALVVTLPVALVAGAIQSAVIGNPMFAILAHMQPGADPQEQAQAFQQAIALWMQSLHDNYVYVALIQFVSSILLSGLGYGAAAYAYRALSGGQPEAVPAPAPAPTPAA